jgi:hypothetical protein
MSGGLLIRIKSMHPKLPGTVLPSENRKQERAMRHLKSKLIGVEKTPPLIKGGKKRRLSDF